jgi:archaeal flagellar protein FlaI
MQPTMDVEISIAELVRNGTMSAEMAAVLWAAVDDGVSYLTAAVPRKAGKSTTSLAALALRRPEVPVHRVRGEPEVMEQLERERLGGYLLVEEISQGRPGVYIWGEPVRRVFDSLHAGYALQTALHAPSVAEAVRIVAEENEVGDPLTSTFKLVLYIERLGEDEASWQRRLADVYELHGVENGKPIGRSLFRWHPAGDHFEKLAEPELFGRDPAELARRADLIAQLAAEGRTAPAEVDAAVAAYRAGQ